MGAVIPLREGIEAMEMTSDEAVSYLNRETGEIITATEVERLVEEEEEPRDDIPGWQRKRPTRSHFLSMHDQISRSRTSLVGPSFRNLPVPR